MKIKLGGLQLDQASTLVQPAMNIKLRQMWWNGGDWWFNIAIPWLPLLVDLE